MYSLKDMMIISATCFFVLVIILLPVILPILFPPIYAGVVVKKSHTPQSIYMTPMNTGKTITHVPRIRPESYSLTISGGEKEATHSVDKSLYDRVKIGDYIDIKGK